MKSVTFVCGSARCGSTMMDLILGNDPRGFSLGEVYALLYPWRTHHFDIKCACGIYPCPVWEQLKPLSEKNLYAHLFERLDKDFIVDSSKRLTWVIDQNLRLQRDPGIRCRNLFLYKDPVSLYYSHWKRGARVIEAIPGIYDYYRNAIRARLPMIAVNYDWFVTNAEEALKLLCGILEIPWFPEKYAFWQKEHHHVFGSFSTRKQLFDRESASIYKEPVDEDFEKRRPDFERALSANSQLGETLRLLRDRDVRNLVEYPDSSHRRVRRPWFYYRDRVAAVRRSRRPEPYPDKEASLIREWRI